MEAAFWRDKPAAPVGDDGRRRDADEENFEDLDVLSAKREEKGKHGETLK